MGSDGKPVNLSVSAGKREDLDVKENEPKDGPKDGSKDRG